MNPEVKALWQERIETFCSDLAAERDWQESPQEVAEVLEALAEAFRENDSSFEAESEERESTELDAFVAKELEKYPEQVVELYRDEAIVAEENSEEVVIRVKRGKILYGSDAEIRVFLVVKEELAEADSNFIQVDVKYN